MSVSDGSVLLLMQDGRREQLL